MTTPLYQLPYLPPGSPAYLTRQTLEDLVTRLEAVLQTKALSPPGTSDLNAALARIGALENDQAAEDALRVPQVVALAAGFAQYNSSPYGELVRCWKIAPDRVRVVGMVSVTAAIAQGAAAVPFATLPAGYRPAVTVNRTAFYQSGSPCRITLQSNGTVSIVPAVAMAAGQWFQLESEFRTVNT